MYGRDINRKKLNDNPVVETIYGETVGFTLPFRIKLFEKWKENPTPETIYYFSFYLQQNSKKSKASRKENTAIGIVPQ